jgi:hypothetical protein
MLRSNFFKHNFPTLATAQKANIFSLFRTLLFYNNPLLFFSNTIFVNFPQEHKFYEIEFLRDSRTPLKFLQIIKKVSKNKILCTCSNIAFVKHFLAFRI